MRIPTISQNKNLSDDATQGNWLWSYTPKGVILFFWGLGNVWQQTVYQGLGQWLGHSGTTWPVQRHFHGGEKQVYPLERLSAT